MPKPRPAPAADDVATTMAMLLPVHAAASAQWLPDAIATAAERLLGAPHALLYLDDGEGTLAHQAPASDLRRRSVQRAMDTLAEALPHTLDPAAMPALAEALDAEHVVLGPIADILAGASRLDAASALPLTHAAFAPLAQAGERLGALLVLAHAAPEYERLRLLAEHVACALLNLRAATASLQQPGSDEEAEVVRTIFDERKTASEIEKELSRAGRYARETSIAIIQATNLRILRDQFGARLTGALVEHLGATLSLHSREIDAIGEYGDSGYTMVLSEATAEGAQAAAHRLRRIAAEVAANDAVPGLELQLATGWATFPADGATAEQLFAAAERRMYDPKSQVA